MFKFIDIRQTDRSSEYYRAPAYWQGPNELIDEKIGFSLFLFAQSTVSTKPANV